MVAAASEMKNLAQDRNKIAKQSTQKNRTSPTSTSSSFTD